VLLGGIVATTAEVDICVIVKVEVDVLVCLFPLPSLMVVTAIDTPVVMKVVVAELRVVKLPELLSSSLRQFINERGLSVLK
jgi:hypothetical protein